MNRTLRIGHLLHPAQVEFVGLDNVCPALARLMNRRLVANLQKLAHRLSITPQLPDNYSGAYAGKDVDRHRSLTLLH